MCGAGGRGSELKGSRALGLSGPDLALERLSGISLTLDSRVRAGSGFDLDVRL